MSPSTSALSLYRRILSRFPKKLSFGFAYGSGVKSQLGYENSRIQDNVLDFIVSVDSEDINQWHRDNLAKNGTDYSGLKRLGPGFISQYQRRIPANVYFNTLVPLPEENVTIKYGVVVTEDLVRDCTEWHYLYLAGRLQKPVTIATETVPAAVASALDRNLSQALSMALLMLPERFTDYDLFYKVAQLSYRGDFRMVFGENPNKVQNIVRPQKEAFMALYEKKLADRRKIVELISPADSTDRVFEVDRSEESLLELVKDLPKRHQRSLTGEYQSSLANSLALTVFRSSAIQSIKNIPTAGLIKAIRYSYSKAKKTFS